jgi:hypothetical protein
MRHCPPGTNWDHLAMYLAHMRRQAAIGDLGDVDMSELRSFDKTQRRSERRERSSGGVSAASDTVAETLEMFKAGKSIEEIAEARELKPITVEGHLVTSIGAGRLDLSALVDDETAAIVRDAIAQTPPSDTPLRDIRATATAIAGRDISYAAINAVRATGDAPPADSPATSDTLANGSAEPSGPTNGAAANGTAAPELQDLLERKAKADQLKARHEAQGKPWPERWEAEYRRIVEQIEALQSSP